MPRLLYLAGILTLSVVVASPVAAKPHSDEASRYNVLFIAIDDLNNGIGALNHEPKAHTPHIDRLAQNGVLFTNAHCAAPACNPSRVAVMTGLHPNSSGVYYNWQDWRESNTLKDATTLPQLFKDNGYLTLGGGKLYHAASLSNWGHEGYLDPEPWDDFFPSKQQQLPKEALPPQVPTNGNKKFYKGFFDWAALEIEDDEMGDAKVVSWAEEILAQDHEQPVFLAVGIYRPHIPWYTPASYFDQYPDSDYTPEAPPDDLDDVPAAGQDMARRHWHEWITENKKWPDAVQAYLASATFADAMVGRLLDALEKSPIADNTVVVLWSDHGYHLGHKEHWEKFALWEQTTNVPLIVAAPGIKRGRQSRRPVSLIDVYPTLAELCELESPPNLDGKSLVPLLKNPDAQKNRVALTTQGPGNNAVRSQNWRYIKYADGSEELYDHRSDPNEFTNLADDPKHQSVTKSHSAKIPNSNAPLDPAVRKDRSDDKPNIVLFFVDDLGWTDVGYRHPVYETPRIDQLASESIDFEQAYIASPTCSPSRSTLVTGKHPARLQIVRHIPGGPKHPDFDDFGRTDVEFNLWPDDPAQFPCRNWLPLEHTTYAEALKRLGYYNLFVGKWHLGHEKFHPVKQGFDRQIGTANAGHPGSYYPPYFKYSDVLEEEKERYLTDKLTDETVAFIEDYDRNQPFMISLWYYGVHKPHIGRKDLVKHFEDKGLEGAEAQYAAMIASVDESVGRVRDTLKAKGVDKDTLIVFTSDQGSWWENPPFRGSKRTDTLGEGGARVPFFVHWPGVTPAKGATNTSIVQTTDLFPTFVEIAGGNPANHEDLDGVSLLSTIKNNATLERGQPVFAYRAYQDLYASVREGPWKLLAYRSGKVNLYNVEKDRYEQADLAEAHPEIVQKLTKQLITWEQEMNVDQFSGVQ
ncbi:MAG: sulfatase-like hydrolase/transferase [Verrucomicrobiota bacterium]